MKQDINGILQAYRGYRIATGAAKALRAAQLTATGIAVASLALGGYRALQKFMQSIS